MSQQEAVEWINASGGIFAIEFTKRTTGETRLMNCRRKCESHLKGGPAAYDPEQHGLIVVFEMPKQAYKAIPVAGITRLKINSVWHTITR